MKALSLCNVRTQKESSYLKAKEGVWPSLDPHHADTLNSHFPAPRIVRNKSLLFNPLSLWHFIIAA